MPTTTSMLGPERLVATVAALLAFLWTLVPALVHLAPPLDVVEGYMWGREWPLVTYKHPAMPAWVIEASRAFTGGQIGWPVYLASQAFVAATIWIVFVLGRDLAGSTRGAIAAVSLAALEHLSWRAPEFNHTIAQLPFWVLVVLATWRAATTGRIVWWLVLGLAAGGGLYAKFSNAIIAIVAAGWLVSDASARRQWTTVGPWLGAAAFLLSVTPLLFWFQRNGLQPFEYARARGEAAGFASFLLRVGLVAAPMLVLMSLAGVLSRASFAEARPEETRGRNFVLVMTVTPIVLIMLAAGLGSSGIGTAWAAPLLLLLPLAIVMLGPHAPTATAFRRFTVAVLAATTLIPPGYAILRMTAGARSDGPTRVNWPQRDVAAAAADAWRRETGKPLRIVAGDTWTAGLAGLSHPDRPSILTDGNMSLAPWITKERMTREGALVIWDARRPPSPSLAALIADRPVRDLVLPPLPRRAREILLRYAVVPPR